MNSKIGSCSEARISKDEDIVMRKGRRKSDFENTNEDLNGSSIEEEDIKSPKCGRKGNVETVNKKTKESNIEEEEIGIRKCRRKTELIKSMRK